MGLAIDILTFLDTQNQISVKNTGWRNGFGLEVSTPIQIHMQNSVAELLTDGDELQLRRVRGPYSEFEALFDSVVDYLNE